MRGARPLPTLQASALQDLQCSSCCDEPAQPQPVWQCQSSGPLDVHSMPSGLQDLSQYLLRLLSHHCLLKAHHCQEPLPPGPPCAEPARQIWRPARPPRRARLRAFCAARPTGLPGAVARFAERSSASSAAPTLLQEARSLGSAPLHAQPNRARFSGRLQMLGRLCGSYTPGKPHPPRPSLNGAAMHA